MRYCGDRPRPCGRAPQSSLPIWKRAHAAASPLTLGRLEREPHGLQRACAVAEQLARVRDARVGGGAGLLLHHAVEGAEGGVVAAELDQRVAGDAVREPRAGGEVLRRAVRGRARRESRGGRARASRARSRPRGCAGSARARGGGHRPPSSGTPGRRSRASAARTRTRARRATCTSSGSRAQRRLQLEDLARRWRSPAPRGRGSPRPRHRRCPAPRAGHRRAAGRWRRAPPPPLR